MVTERERDLFTTLGQLLGFEKIDRERVQRWQSEAARLPRDIPAKELCAVATWAIGHKFWTTRVTSMGKFVENFDTLLGEYRGAMRAKVIEEQEKAAAEKLSPEGKALLDSYPGFTRSQVLQEESKQRYRMAFQFMARDCNRCNGEPFVPVRANYPDGTLPKGFQRAVADGQVDEDGNVLCPNGELLMVPCKLCKEKMGKRYSEIYGEVGRLLGL